MRFFLTICLLFLLFQGYSATYTVTNNNDSGVGSLRQAIIDANANAGIDNIEFAIASSTAAGRTITLSSTLPSIDEGVIIDGTTQSLTAGSAFGISDAYIAIEGQSWYTYCFELDAQDIEIYGLYIYNFAIAIRSWFGAPRGNNTIGAPSKGNVLSGNGDGIFMYSGDNTVIQSNIIGLEPDGVTANGNSDDGIFIFLNGTESITIGGLGVNEGNLVSSNANDGITCRDAQYTIQGNIVGSDYTATLDRGNGTEGIRLSNGTDNSLVNENTVLYNGSYGINAGGDNMVIGGGNTIGFNASYAVIVFGDNNLITQNSMFDNGSGGGIRLNYGNNNKNTPAVAFADATQISGTADAGDQIEIFVRDNVGGNCEGITYLASVTADGSGNWSYAGDFSGCGSYIVTATDAANNTSEFSPCPVPPSPPTYSGPTSFCGGVVDPLTATGTGGATFNWYSDAGLTNLVFTGNPYTGMSATGSIWVTQVVGGCASSALKIDITVTPAVTGANCSNAHLVTGLPFSQTALTTCGACNSYEDTDPGVTCSVGDYMTDEDYVFEYTPSASELVNVSLDNTGNWTGVFIFDGCPDDPTTNCIGNQTEILGDPSISGVNLISGETYYIVVSSDEWAGCTAFDINITTCNSPGTSCSTAESIGSLPYTTSSTTCGYCNFYSSSDACGSSYMNSEEHVYTYTPSSNQEIIISMANTPTVSGVFLLDGCPDAPGTNCVDSWTTSSIEDGGYSIVNVVGGTTYYLIISSNSSNCGSYDLAVFEKPPTPPCFGTAIDAGDSASTAAVFCNLESFCGNTSADYSDDDASADLNSEFCGSIDNSSWVSFIAEATTATLVIEVGNCGGVSGIQAQMYSTSDFIDYTPVSNCWSPGVIETGYVTATGLVPNQMYYLMIDGYGGEVCDYAVSVATGNQQPISVNDTSICAGQTATLTVTGGDGGVYNWDHGPSGQTVNVTPTIQTDYIVTNTSAHPACDQVDTATVTVINQPTVDFSDASICAGSAANIDVYFTGNDPFELHYSDGNGANDYHITGITANPYTISVSVGGLVAIDSIRDSSCYNDTVGRTATVTANAMDNPSFNFVDFCENAIGTPVITGNAGGNFSFDPDPGDGATIHSTSGGITNATGGTTYFVKYLTQGACPDSLTLQVGAGTLPNPGGDSTIDLCNNLGTVDLFNYLSGIPEAGGNWQDNNNVNQANGQINTLMGNTLDGSHSYTMLGDSGCADSTAIITIDILDSLWAGMDSSITLCDNQVVGLADYLQAGAQAGGNWLAPNGEEILNDSLSIDTAVAGVYSYVLNPTLGCSADTALITLSIIVAPDAGTFMDTALCSSAGNIDLFTFLAGMPIVGGIWNYPNTIGNETGLLDAVNGVSGLYTYTVSGGVGCPDDTASVWLTIYDSVSAGENNTIILCSDSLVGLNDFLNQHDAGGIWYAPNGTEVISDSLLADTAVSGNYLYVLNAAAPCKADTAVINITINGAPNAGLFVNSSFCSDTGVIDLLTVLQGLPEASGTWDYPGGFSNQNGLLDMLTAVDGNYLYTVVGAAGCKNDTASLDLTIQNAKNAGADNAISICSDSILNLNNTLIGADPGGFWKAPDGNNITSSFVSADTANSGIYSYIISAASPCISDTAFITISISPAPDAGDFNDTSLCSNEGLLDLVELLSGTPDLVGSWEYPNGSINQSNSINAVFAEDGIYKYTVNGGAGCSADTASLNLLIEDSVNAGVGGSYSLCSDSTIDLADFVTGEDAGGVWKDPSGVILASSSLNLSGAVSGIYHYVISGVSPCSSDSAAVVLTISSAVSAGIDIDSSLCSSAGPLNLSTFLNGAVAGGDFIYPGIIGNQTGFFDAASPSAVTGVYLYVVSGSGGCSADTAEIDLTFELAVNAGISDSADVCNNTVAFDLTAELGGAPDIGGTWYSPTWANLGGNTIDGATATSGLYHYVVTGTSPCPDDTTFINVNVTAAPDAGSDSLLALCSGSSVIDLDTIVLSPAVGTWKDPSNITMPNGLIDPSNAGAAGVYEHIVLAPPGCLDDTAQVTVTVSVGPNAGNDVTHSICDGTNSFDMEMILSGHDAGGFWFNSDTSARGANGNDFVTAVDTAGIYYYRVDGVDPCPDAYAQVTISVSTQTNAGGDSVVYACRNDDTLNLLENLAGSPDLVGTWTAPDGSQVGTTINISVADSGVYVYSVPANGSCSSGTAELRVVINDTAYAGRDSSIDFCNTTATALHLTRQLGGLPDSTGDVRWFDYAGASLGAGVHSTLVSNASDGIYTYVVVGKNGCRDDTSLLSVNIDTFLSAGNDNSIDVCVLGQSVDLQSIILGTPDSNGVWFLDGLPVTDPFTVLNSGLDTFYYVHGGPAVGVCPSDTSKLEVQFNAPISAGLDSTLGLCEDLGTINLNNYLREDSSGGFWEESAVVIASSVVLNPALDGNHIYSYIIEGNAGCSNDTAFITIDIDSSAVAGGDNAVSLCGSAPSVSLFDQIVAPYDLTGTWQAPNGTTVWSDSLRSDTAETGDYLYIVASGIHCPSDTAVFSLSVGNSANAGANESISVCRTDSIFALHDILGGAPEDSGVWYRSDWTVYGAFDTIVNANSVDSGLYYYVVSGVAGCIDDTSELTLNIVSPPEAGSAIDITFCETGRIDLADYLVASDTGGIWMNPNGDQLGDDSLRLDTTTMGAYNYIVSGVGCTSDTAQLLLTIGRQLVAGSDASINICATDSVDTLINLLAGSPSDSGQWFLSGLNYGVWDTFASTADSGVYSYIVFGTEGCLNDTAELIINRVGSVSAGLGHRVSACEDSVIDLATILTGTWDPGGIWQDSVGGSLSGTQVRLDTAMAFSPVSYFYIVSGGGSCVSDTAEVVIEVGTQLEAGIGYIDSVCNGDLFTLFDSLSGGPDAGGIWYLNGVQFGSWDTTVSAQDGVFEYIHAGGNGCTNDTATLVIDVPTIFSGSGPQDTTVEVCQNVIFGLNDFLPVLFGGGGQEAGFIDCYWVNQDGVRLPVDSVNMDTLTLDTASYRIFCDGLNCFGGGSGTLTIIKKESPNAGVDYLAGYCLPETVNLFLNLGAYDAGGSWSGPSTISDPENYNLTFTWQEGFYSHIVKGDVGCISDTAIANIEVDKTVNAGSGGNLEFCETAVTENINTWLEFGFDSSGTWEGDLPVSGTNFDPSGRVGGTATYVLNGGHCPADSASFEVTVAVYDTAGNDTSSNVCDNSGFGLLTLNGGVNTGQWFYNGDPLTSIVDLTTFTADNSPYNFVYFVDNQAPCPDDMATHTLHVGEYYAQPITDISEYLYCQDSTVFVDLANEFRRWPGGQLFDSSGNIVPSTIIQNDEAFSQHFHYIVAGDSGCPMIDYQIDYSVEAKVNLGTATIDSICYLDSSYRLIDYLGGNPDSTGYWLYNNDTLWSGRFNPYDEGVDRSSFTYTHSSKICGGSASGLTLVFGSPDEPGMDTSLLVCDSDSAILLYDALAGDPNRGGVWSFGGVQVDTFFRPDIQVAGRYTYTQDNRQNNCPELSAHVEIALISAPEAAISIADSIGCAPHTTILNSVGNYPSDATFSWKIGNHLEWSGQDPGSVTVDSPGIYDVIFNVFTPACPNTKVHARRALTVFDTPNAAFSSDGYEANLDEAIFTFTNQSTPENAGLNFVWDFEDSAQLVSNDLEVIHAFEDTGFYAVLLSARDTNGCMDTTSRQFHIKPIFKIFFPNTFTPNDDGLNDEFHAVFHPSAVTQYEMTVFTRWGEIVYNSSDIFGKWDGTWYNQGKGMELPGGMYTYIVRVRDAKGQRHDPIRGRILLIR